MLPILISINSYIQTFFHANLDEMEAKKTMLFKARWFLSRGTRDEFHQMDESHRISALRMVRRIISELEQNPIPIPTPIFGLRSQSPEDIYIALLPEFEDLHMKIKEPNCTIKTSEFIDELTMIEKEIKKAIATLHSKNTSTRSLFSSAAVIVPNLEVLDLTEFDPSRAATIIGRKISWNDEELVHYGKLNNDSPKIKYCCF